MDPSLKNLIGRRISQTAGMPMQWGRDDCVLFACNISKDITGEDAALPVRGRYGSEEEAEALFNISSGGLIRTFLKRVVIGMKWRSVSPSQAAPGALGLSQYTADGSFMMVVAIGGGWFLARTDTGVLHLRSNAVRKAWQCPPQSL